MREVVQGRAPAVRGYISVESDAKGRVTARNISIEKRWTEVLPCRCSNVTLKVEQGGLDEVTIGDVALRCRRRGCTSCFE